MADDYYVQRGDKRIGPVSLEKVKKALTDGKIAGGDFVWREGWPEWKRADEVASGGRPAAVAANAGESDPYDVVAEPTPLRRASNDGHSLDYRTAGSYRQAGVSASEAAITALVSTRPWVRFISILLFIAVGLSTLVIVFMFLGALLAASQDARAVVAVLPPLLSGAFMLLYFFPALYLHRYAGAISRLQQTNSATDLEDALIQQKSFWKFIGIVTLVVIGLYVLMLLAMLVLIGVAGTM